MVSIYSLRPVYNFLYTIIHGNVIASFVQKTKSFEILWSKKFFSRTYTTLKPPLSPCTQSYAFGLTPPYPFVRTYYADDPEHVAGSCQEKLSEMIFRDFPLMLNGLSELINLYSPWNHQKIIVFLIRGNRS